MVFVPDQEAKKRPTGTMQGAEDQQTTPPRTTMQVAQGNHPVQNRHSDNPADFPAGQVKLFAGNRSLPHLSGTPETLLDMG